MKMGLIVAPSCNDCHGVHDIKRSIDKDSHSNHANIAKSCGKCHVGIEETYNASVHGQLLVKGDKRGPVCTDCHSAHDIEKPATAHFKGLSDQSCGKCHEDRLEHYRETYHGKAMALGQPERRLRRRRLLRLPRPPRRLPGQRPALAPVEGPDRRAPARSATPASTSSSPNTSRTPTRWTRSTIPCSTRSSCS